MRGVQSWAIGLITWVLQWAGSQLPAPPVPRQLFQLCLSFRARGKACFLREASRTACDGPVPAPLWLWGGWNWWSSFSLLEKDAQRGYGISVWAQGGCCSPCTPILRAGCACPGALCLEGWDRPHLCGRCCWGGAKAWWVHQSQGRLGTAFSGGVWSHQGWSVSRLGLEASES